VTIPGRNDWGAAGLLRQSNGMSKSGSVAINCTNARVAGSQVREPVTRCEGSEENWVRPKKSAAFRCQLGLKQ